jgi:hypothetical protein
MNRCLSQARVPDWRDRIVEARPLQLMNVHRLDNHESVSDIFDVLRSKDQMAVTLLISAKLNGAGAQAGAIQYGPSVGRVKCI